MYLCNAFSLNMLTNFAAEIFTRPITADDVRDFHKEAPLVSAVGHPDTARVFAEALGFDVAENRINVKLADHERIIVGQYSGPRLEPGTATLPTGAKIEWLLVGVRYVSLKHFRERLSMQDGKMVKVQSSNPGRPARQGGAVRMEVRRFGYFPKAFVWRGRRYEVEAVERCWTVTRRWVWAVERHCFRVRCKEGTLELYQDVRRNTWHVGKFESDAATRTIASNRGDRATRRTE